MEIENRPTGEGPGPLRAVAPWKRKAIRMPETRYSMCKHGKK
jgi:hypothetical protein